MFHSEADFQHALARPFTESAHIDLIATQEGVSVAIELKYKTRDFTSTIGTEIFRLKGQSAQDTGRYDFLKDISRVENVVSGNPRWVGIALLLTNDSSYWKLPNKADSVDAAFRLHEGRKLSGILAWSPAASRGTKKARESSLIIQGTYTATWEDYSTLSVGGYSTFRYLFVEVIAKDQAA